MASLLSRCDGEDEVNHADAFAGIGGFGLAARRVGWKTVWACEIEPSARAIYQHHFGDVRFDRDIRESTGLPPIDILTGGFPCQDLSVAGKRGGLSHADGTATRSGLFFELVRILEESRPTWFVFENVPGLLSHDAGRTMGIILSTLVECGYGVAYRVLNAQFFGVAQRRRRVFLVGHSGGDELRAAAVLFEPQGVRRDSAQGGEARENIAHSLSASTTRSGRLDPNGETYVTHLVADPIKTGTSQYGNGWTNGSVIALAQNQRGELRTSNVAPALGHGGGKPGEGYSAIIPIDLRQTSRGDKLTNNRTHGSGGAPGTGVGESGDPAFTVSGRQQAVSAPADAARVRTAPGLPRPLDVCLVCENGPDSPRYRGLGNAVAVPVVTWLFRRIEAMK